MTGRAALGALLLLLPACSGAQAPERKEEAGTNAAAQPTSSLSPTGGGNGSAVVDASAPLPAGDEAQAVSATAHPLANSPQRAAIMNALRPAIERKLGGPVEFVVNRVSVQDGWALVIADPQRPGGGRIDPRRHFPHEVIEFMDGLTINAVLRFSGGGWTLVDHAIGPTDVWYCGVEGPPKSLTGC